MNDQNNLAGERIRGLRELLGMSQTKLAFATGVASNYISALEKGRRKPGVKMCNRIIEICSQQDIKIDHYYLRPDLEAG